MQSVASNITVSRLPYTKYSNKLNELFDAVNVRETGQYNYNS